MAKRQIYQVAGETFPTKKALTERVRGIVASYADGAELGPGDLAFMADLLENHPQAETKIGAGVERITVIRNPVYTHTRGFYLHRIDGSGTDFSWVECLTPTPHYKKVRAALRVAIEPDTMEYKRRFFDANGGAAVCPIAGTPITFTSAHVDHAPPKTFLYLMADFLEGRGLDPAEIEIAEERADNKYQDRLADPFLEAAWVEYHRAEADLRVISRWANLSTVKIAGTPEGVTA